MTTLFFDRIARIAGLLPGCWNLDETSAGRILLTNQDGIEISATMQHQRVIWRVAPVTYRAPASAATRRARGPVGVGG